MRIARIEHRTYTVPFRAPFTTAHGSETHRCGLLVRLTTDDGTTGLGEAAPLPAFGTGTLDDTMRHLTSFADHLIGASLSEIPRILDAGATDQTAAPARFALDTASLDAEARHAGLPLARYLTSGAADSVPVNATVDDADAARAAAAARKAVDRGYGAIKLKVGMLSTEEEVARVQAVREAIGPHAELRLDANGAWTLSQATVMADRLDGLSISYLEQPLPPGELREMAQLRSDISIPIAADEAATTPDAIRRIVEAGAADVLIIKPGVIGGLRAAREVIELARTAGMRIVITTALETGVGIAAALHLAATLPQPVPACGLATGQLLQTDLLVESLPIEDGHMMLPGENGLGVVVVIGAWK